MKEGKWPSLKGVPAKTTGLAEKTMGDKGKSGKRAVAERLAKIDSM